MPPGLTAALALRRNLPSPHGIPLRIIELAQDRMRKCPMYMHSLEA